MEYLRIIFKYRVLTLIVLLMLFYVLQGFFVKLGLGLLQYILTILLFIIVVFRKPQCEKIKPAYTYLYMGGVSFLISLVVINENSLFVAACGFFLNYCYFFLWTQFFRNYNYIEISSVLNIYIKLFILLGVCSALLGIYQVFVDASIGGFALNELYGDVDLMSSGRFKSRATGLFGSAQNYGCFMGVAFCLGIFYRFKNRFLWLISMFIILLGVIVSNSRSSSSCVIIGLILGIYFYNKQKSKSISKTILYFLFFILIVYFVSLLVIDYDLDKYSRLLNFDNKLARDIYSNTFVTTDFFNLIMGHGLGFRQYTVNQIIGEQLYHQSFGVNYMSCESFFMTIWVQGGIILLIPVISLIFKILLKSYKHCTFPIIICIVVNMIFTPSLTGLSVSFLLWPILLNEIKRPTIPNAYF